MDNHLIILHGPPELRYSLSIGPLENDHPRVVSANLTQLTLDPKPCSTARGITGAKRYAGAFHDQCRVFVDTLPT